MEESRRRSEEMIQAAFLQLAAGFSMMDLQGRFIRVNQAYCRLTGYSEEELLKMSFQSITYPEDLARDLESLKRLLAGEISHFVLQKRCRMKTGDVVWVQDSVSAVPGENGAVSGFLALTEDITARKRAENKLRQLSGRLLQLQDEERRKIARDLHDSTGQDLVVLSTTLGQLKTSLPSSLRKPRRLVAQCQAVMDRCVREIRTLSYLLHPPMLDEAGLADAIRHYAGGFAERTGIEVELEISPRFGRLAPDAELALFRVIQESLVNIHRHSGSFSARIRLNQEPRGATLEISDEGRGIPGGGRGPNKGLPPAAGVGMHSMQERVKQIGGQLEIESSSGGTTVRVKISSHG